MRISDLTALTTATDDSVLVINDGTPTTKKITVANFKASSSIPIYSAKLFVTQSGTSAVSIGTIKNTFGVNPVSTYVSAGVYTLTLNGLLTNFKTSVKIYNGNLAPTNFISAYRSDVNTVTIKTYDSGVASNDILSSTVLEIEVYA